MQASASQRSVQRDMHIGTCIAIWQVHFSKLLRFLVVKVTGHCRTSRSVQRPTHMRTCTAVGYVSQHLTPRSLVCMHPCHPQARQQSMLEMLAGTLLSLSPLITNNKRCCWTATQPCTGTHIHTSIHTHQYTTSKTQINLQLAYALVTGLPLLGAHCQTGRGRSGSGEAGQHQT